MERGTDGRKQGHDAGKTAKNFASRTDNKDIKKETVFLGKVLEYSLKVYGLPPGISGILLLLMRYYCENYLPQYIPDVTYILLSILQLLCC